MDVKGEGFENKKAHFWSNTTVIGKVRYILEREPGEKNPENGKQLADIIFFERNEAISYPWINHPTKGLIPWCYFNLKEHGIEYRSQIVGKIVKIGWIPDPKREGEYTYMLEMATEEEMLAWQEAHPIPEEEEATNK